MFALGQNGLETRVLIKSSTQIVTQQTLTDFHGDEAKNIF